MGIDSHTYAREIFLAYPGPPGMMYSVICPPSFSFAFVQSLPYVSVLGVGVLNVEVLCSLCVMKVSIYVARSSD